MKHIRKFLIFFLLFSWVLMSLSCSEEDLKCLPMDLLGTCPEDNTDRGLATSYALMMLANSLYKQCSKYTTMTLGTAVGPLSKSALPTDGCFRIDTTASVTLTVTNNPTEKVGVDILYPESLRQEFYEVNPNIPLQGNTKYIFQVNSYFDSVATILVQ